jgi:hypothetical protein
MRQLKARESRGSAVIGGGFDVVLVPHDSLELYGGALAYTVFRPPLHFSIHPSVKANSTGPEAFRRKEARFSTGNTSMYFHVTVVQSQVAVDMGLSNDFCHGWEASDKENMKHESTRCCSCLPDGVINRAMNG